MTIKLRQLVRIFLILSVFFSAVTPFAAFSQDSTGSKMPFLEQKASGDGKTAANTSIGGWVDIGLWVLTGVSILSLVVGMVVYSAPEPLGNTDLGLKILKKGGIGLFVSIAFWTLVAMVL